MGENGWVYMVLAPGSPGDAGDASFLLQRADATGAPAAPAAVVSSADLPAAVAALEEPSLRWVWEGTRRSYLPLLRAGTTVERCHDLSLTRELLVLSQYAADTPYVRALRADSPPILVALTGYGRDKDKQRSQEAGFALHLVKPIDGGLLVQLLDTLG